MKIKNLPAIIFFGSIWGIIEATLGYVLHLLPVSIYISGTVLFPIVTLILYKAYKYTNSKSSLLAIGGIAALIKAVDFFMPFGSPFKIINPIYSIIIESLMVFAVIILLDKDDLLSKIKALTIASIGWRLLYLAYNGGQYLINGFVSDYLASFSAAIQFVLIFGIISSILGLGLLYLDSHVSNKSKNTIKKINPLISLATLVIAIVLTIFA